MPGLLARLRIGRDTTAATHANLPQRVAWEADVERTMVVLHGRAPGVAGRPVIDARTAGSDPDRVQWAEATAHTVDPAIVGFDAWHQSAADENSGTEGRGPDHWWNTLDAETEILVEPRLYERPDRPPVREAAMRHGFTLRPFDQWTTQTFPGYKNPEDTGASPPRGRLSAFGLPQRNTQRQTPAPWDALLTTEQSAPAGFGEI